ncbi:MAG: hypothetical protein A2381_11785 [Bdellovibrionales bacterium RIFOXYB1_FULL_37_110]|nr:MAG: hypothetical protein A2181_05620 [Bdellovibrionales bacterium RIFOXYA1_FULL_38_20]OFZ49236.1 MAG: hypothetical protein A2417_17025 [Bdellovibrionales bacterium RIFOXYC1_FULL_37_79]OFZ58484.1 MAG: hypothetical protein A2381_11785 [Bdellovibrionales bacterium RIFOXYB1_FULL_37_110]OFZ61497.1 MAG: hypothetical protein A2577_00305 [Bdellovibrionales bacterium RIFOXYD1_FULL_36_51]
MNQNNTAVNLSKMHEFLEKNQLDAMFINDTDRYLNEYVPRDQAHYYLLTQFSGSTCKLLITKHHKARLYVDGRYHQQAEHECDLDQVEVVKCPQTISIFHKLLEDLNQLNIKKLGVDGQRTSVMEEENIIQNAKCDVSYFDQDELVEVIPLSKSGLLKPLKHLEVKVCGSDPLSKARSLINEGEMYLVSALDSIAWVTNARGFHQPFQSTFFARCILTYNKIYVFNIDEQAYETNFAEPIVFKHISVNQWADNIKAIASKLQPSKVYYDKECLTGADYRILRDIFAREQLSAPKERIILKQSIKNDNEIEVLKRNFQKSSQVVAETIRQIKRAVKENKKLLEKDLYDMTNENYKRMGAIDLSFNTIAAVGANASIVHYGKASDQVMIKNGDMLLLDSGAIYEEGYATDKTRTFLVGELKDPKLKKIYTLVLKGLLNAQNAIVPEGTLGAAIDILARNPILQHGYNYLHGTGHGIGINTHEGGIAFSFKNNMPIKMGQVVSIEPGIYIAGYGGVRLENVVVVEKNPSIEGTLRFRPLVNIGFDHDLIDFNLLTKEEQKYLEVYEAECEKQKTLI